MSAGWIRKLVTSNQKVTIILKKKMTLENLVTMTMLVKIHWYVIIHDINNLEWAYTL